MPTIIACRDGMVYGCGSTEYGQLPYLRFSSGAGASDNDDDAPERGEITVPTRLRLQFLQVCSCFDQFKLCTAGSLPMDVYGQSQAPVLSAHIPEAQHSVVMMQPGRGNIMQCNLSMLLTKFA